MNVWFTWMLIEKGTSLLGEIIVDFNLTVRVLEFFT